MKFKRNLIFDKNPSDFVNSHDVLIFSMLENLDSLDENKIMISEEINNYLAMFNEEGIDTNRLIKNLKPILNNFDGINVLNSSEKVCSEKEVFGQLITRKNLSSVIVLNTDNSDDFKHYSKHSLCHLMSVNINNGEISSNLKDYPVIDDLFTEFYTEKLEEFEFLKLPKQKYKLETTNDEFKFITSSKEYFPIAGYAHILDSVLHNEFLNAKLLGDNSGLELFKPYLIELNNRLDNVLSIGPSIESYRAVNNCLENLLTKVLINKYKNLSNEETYNDYMDLRRSLLNYGEVNIQKDIVRNLDSLMLERFIGKVPSRDEIFEFRNLLDVKDAKTFANFKEEFKMEDKDMKKDLSLNPDDFTLSHIGNLGAMKLLRLEGAVNEKKELINKRLQVDEYSSTYLSSFKVGLDKMDKIADNIDDYFRSVLSTKIHTNKKFEDILKGLQDVSEFNELRNNDGDNFLLYSVKNGFDNLSEKIGDVEKLFFIRDSLTSGFSLLDKDNKNENVFSYIVKNNDNEFLISNIVQILNNSGEFKSAIDGLDKNVLNTLKDLNLLKSEEIKENKQFVLE